MKEMEPLNLLTFSVVQYRILRKSGGKTDWGQCVYPVVLRTAVHGSDTGSGGWYNGNVSGIY